MKSSQLLSLLLASSLVFVGAINANEPFTLQVGSPAPRANIQEKICQLQQMSQSELEAFFCGKADGTVVQCNQGARIPVTLNLTGDWIGFEDGAQPSTNVLMRETTFIKVDNNTPYFSLDGVSWKSFSEFVGGNLTLVVNVQNDQPNAQVNSELTIKR